ncbi:hypothetical protein [Streptomyces sulphureus]|uniref:hypothetical protein n=1 Tax=Streptomyces sulphureus TaxID=47758 RepID=UPI0003664F86|nr:hypothetical protein [Streptomyces sulphureus]
MTNPYTGPIPPAPRPPDTRPLHKRVLVWLGGSALFLTGLIIGTAEDTEQQPVTAKPATTVTTTATPAPAPTVTRTVKAKPKPGPTVTVTEQAPAEPADSDDDTAAADNTDEDTTTENNTGSCTLVSNSGNCYSAGQYCRNSDHGATTTNEAGRTIKCTYSSNAWRWTYA